jgi:hypothetical protein
MKTLMLWILIPCVVGLSDGFASENTTVLTGSCLSVSNQSRERSSLDGSNAEVTKGVSGLRLFPRGLSLGICLTAFFRSGLTISAHTIVLVRSRLSDF